MAESTADLVAGRFRVGRLIGAGAQGRVVAAHDELLDRPVALKILQSSVPDSHARARFLREARAAAALVHPNVVTVFDIGAVDGPLTGDGTTPYIAMELVDGPSLAQVIADRGPLSITDAVEVTRQILAGLGAAHARGLLHRDVKPSNALLAPDGTVKLTDFGIATTAAGGMTLTEPGAVLGTVAYLAPERVAGEAATVASDLYAVGVVLYEMLAGTPPFRGDTAVAIALAHSTQAPPSLAERRAGLGEEAVGEELDALVGRALAKDPAARFASAAEMDAALAGTPTDRGVPRSATSRARTPAPAAAAAGAVAAGPPGGPWGDGTTRALPVAEQDLPSAPGRRRRPRGVLPAVAVLLALAVAAILVGAALDGRGQGPGRAGDTARPAVTASASPPATPAPSPPETADPGLDDLIARLEADPDRYGERGEELLDRLVEVREADAEDVPRLATDTTLRAARWARRDELDPAVAAETARVLARLGANVPAAPAEDDDD